MADVYARAGEVVTCENGHPVGELLRDVIKGEVMGPDQFKLVDGHVMESGELTPKCKICDAAAFNMQGQAHFASDGWRHLDGV